MSSASLNAGLLPVPLLILVPQGPEYQAIAKGLGQSQGSANGRWLLQGIPAGEKALSRFLSQLPSQWTETIKPAAVLVMGVTGSLTCRYGVGQPVLVTDCQFWPPNTLSPTYAGDLRLSETLAVRLAADGRKPIPFVKGITVSEVIAQATEKQALAQQSGAEVVDMENAIILHFAQQHHLPVAILRVVSDGGDRDLPDLQDIYDQNGNLKGALLAWRFLQRPRAAFHLIRGSLTACGVLQQLARRLF